MGNGRLSNPLEDERIKPCSNNNQAYLKDKSSTGPSLSAMFPASWMGVGCDLRDRNDAVLVTLIMTRVVSGRRRTLGARRRKKWSPQLKQRQNPASKIGPLELTQRFQMKIVCFCFASH
jgi:hypothetical protein